MSRWTAPLLAVALLAALPSPAEAQWKWRDRNGQIQYSDLPPPAGIADKDILTRPTSGLRAAPVAAAASAASAAASGPALPRGVDPELEARRKLAEQAEADKRKAEEAKATAIRADNCNRAREQMRTLDSGIRISRVNPRGEREVLDDAARAEESRRARDAMAADCR